MVNLGYCCISIGCNEGLNKSEHIKINRGMVKKTFDLKGLEYVSELAILNIDDFFRILQYNIQNNITHYRMSSDMFPCLGFYNLNDLPYFNIIEEKLFKIGSFIKSNNLRVSFHPSHFCVLSSTNDIVVDKTIDELDKHSQIMDIMGLEQSHQYPINIHIGTTQPSREVAADKFCKNFHRLSISCQKRLTIENDDTPNKYSVRMLYQMIYEKIGIPIVVDSLHYMCHSDDMSWEDTLKMGISTWPKNITPICHHSSSKKIFEDDKSTIKTHSDLIYEKFENLGYTLDVELECKSKDIALIKYRKDFNL